MFINKITKEYPRFIGDIQILHPEATLENLPEDWILVATTPKPEYQEGKAIYEIAPEEINGYWTQQWNVRDFNAEELEMHRKNNEKVSEFLAKLEAVQDQ
jgi:hypothetical protein